MEINDEELRYVRSLLRMDHRRTERKIISLQKKFGGDGGLEAKLAFIEEFYKRLHPTGQPSWLDD